MIFVLLTLFAFSVGFSDTIVTALGTVMAAYVTAKMGALEERIKKLEEGQEKKKRK